MSSLISKIKNLFKKEIEPSTKSPPKKKSNLQTLNSLDDIWVKENDKIYDGWVVEIKDNQVYGVYSKDRKLLDVFFQIERPLNRTEIPSNNLIIYLNKPENESERSKTNSTGKK